MKLKPNSKVRAQNVANNHQISIGNPCPPLMKHNKTPKLGTKNVANNHQIDDMK
jgi:hypothetical protein